MGCLLSPDDLGEASPAFICRPSEAVAAVPCAHSPDVGDLGRKCRCDLRQRRAGLYQEVDNRVGGKAEAGDEYEEMSLRCP